MQDFFVYILLCNDGTYYTGHTDDMDARLGAHEGGFYKDCYTKTRLPVKLVFVEARQSRAQALETERQIKNWSRKKKEALIKADFILLKQYGKKKF